MLTPVKRFLLRLRATFSPAHDRELRDELDLHVELLEEEYVARGMAADLARVRAQREFGNRAKFQEASRDLFAFPLFEGFLNDVRYAFGEMRRSPGFTWIAVLSLAVGIGSLTTTFSVVDAFMLRSLPVHDPDRLVAFATSESSDWTRWPHAPFTAWRNSPDRSFEVAAASDVRTYQLPLTGNATTAGEVRVTLVSGNYFDVVGADVVVGRPLTRADESLAGGALLAVISEAFWNRWFGRSPDILTNAITLNGRRYTIVGVTRKHFGGLAVAQPSDVWIPLTMQRALMPDAPDLLHGRGALEVKWLTVVGRLGSGVTRQQAPVSANLIYQRFVTQLAAELGESHREVIRSRKQSVALLSAARGFAPERTRYALGVRMALGATNRSVAVLVLWDSVKLVLPALAIGIPLGVAASRPLSGQLYDVAITDVWTLTSVAALLMIVSLVATFRPANRASHIDPIALLRRE